MQHQKETCRKWL